MCTHDHNNWMSIKEINYRNIDRHVSQYCLYFILFFDGIKIVAELEFELRGGGKTCIRYMHFMHIM